MNKFDMPNNDFVQEKDINSELEVASNNISGGKEMLDVGVELVKTKKDRKEYCNQPVSKKEISGFKEETEKKIEKRAMEFGISKEELADLNDNFDNLSEKIKIKGGEIKNNKLEKYGCEELFTGLEDLKKK